MQKVNLDAQIIARKRFLARDLEEENKGNQARMASLKIHLSKVDAELRKRPSPTGSDPDSDKASEALDIAHKEQLLQLKKYYSDKEHLQKEYQARELAMELAHLKAKAAIEPDEGKRLDLQAQIIDKQSEYSKVLKEAVPEILNADDAVKKFNTRQLELAELTDYASDKLRKGTNASENYRAKQLQQAETVQMVGNVITDYVTGAINGQLDEYATFGDTLILMSLQVLKQMVPIWSAQILGYSLASPESVATWGAAGMAKYAAITAIMYAAISGVEAAVQGGINKKREKAEKTSQYASGKYPVTGADDGRLYNANFAGRPKTGIYSGPQLGLFNEDPSLPELVVDGRTTRQLMIDYPAVYRGIRQLAVGGTPQFADGKYPAPASAPQPLSSSDPELKALLSKLSSQLDKPIRASVNKFGRGGIDEAITDINTFKTKVNKK